MDARVKQVLQGSVESALDLGECSGAIASAGERLAQTLLNDGKVLVAGNGSSAALGQIFVANLVNRLKQERPGLPAIHLAADTVAITAIANDNSYHDIFAKQVRALGQSGDVLVLITTSGKSSNLIHAVAAAHDRGLAVLALTANDGGDIATLLNSEDVELRAPVRSIAYIQQAHLLFLYCLCDLVDLQLFGVQHSL